MQSNKVNLECQIVVLLVLIKRDSISGEHAVKANQRVLGVFTLAFINVAAIISLRNLSLVVEFGFSSVFYYLLASLVFFIPCALVCAELATGWPKAGGVFRWVSEAFNSDLGFFAVWVAWMLSISWFPVILTFSAATLAYIFNPELANSKGYMVSTMLIIFWGTTFCNFLGMKVSGWVSTLGAIVGTIFPGALIIGLGIVWIWLKKDLQIDISAAHFWPTLQPGNMVFFAGLLLGLAGMEMSAFHAREAKNPQRDYPRSIFISTLIILFISIFGSLAIAFVVPQQDLNLVAGLMQAFNAFFEAFGFPGLLPLIALIATLGSLGGINTWILGPAKGILSSGVHGYLPLWMHTVNSKGIPVATLLIQAIIGSLLALVFFFMPDVNSAFWIITALTVQFAMLMYMFIFAAAIRLRFTQPHQARRFKIPGQHFGICIVGGVGFLTCLFAFFIGYVPPAQLNTGDLWFYEGYLLASFILLCLAPIILIYIKKPHWKETAKIQDE